MTDIGTTSAIKSSKPVTIEVSVSAATPEYPARVLIARSGLSEHKSTTGYFDAKNALELAALLVKAAEHIKAMPVDEQRAAGPVTVRRTGAASSVDGAMVQRMEVVENSLATLSAGLTELLNRTQPRTRATRQASVK